MLVWQFAIAIIVLPHQFDPRDVRFGEEFVQVFEKHHFIMSGEISHP
jgi:hypothetical protein